ncbi:hypothetical protein HY572_03485 [Candidatus Micrarchaeota archaeon]|nr:hypothetical protein [Candidatus Micrarchaeota archaeon]
MVEKESYSWLDEYLDAVEAALGNMDFSTLQPCSHQHVMPLAAAEWLEWFEGLMDACEERQIPFSDIADAFSPALAWEHFFFVLETMKAARWPREKRLRTARFFENVFRAGFKHNPFGKKRECILDSDEKIRQTMTQPFQEGTVSAARSLGKLYNASYNLAAAWYLDFFMGIGAVNDGPYRLDDKTALLHKAAPDLKPDLLWPEARKMPFKRLDWFQAYEGITISVDLISCHTRFDGNAVNALKGWRLLVDEKSVTDLEEVDELTDGIAETAKAQWTALLKMPEEKIIEKSLWIRCYAFKKLCERAEWDWRPTKTLLEAGKSRTFAQGYATWNPPKGEKNRKAYWRKIWDPRLDFYP